MSDKGWFLITLVLFVILFLVTAVIVDSLSNPVDQWQQPGSLNG